MPCGASEGKSSPPWEGGGIPRRLEQPQTAGGSVGGSRAIHLLRLSYREDGKVKDETVGNLSHPPPPIV